MKEKEGAEVRVIRMVHGIIDWTFVIFILILYVFGIYAIWDSYTVIENASPNKYEVYKAEGDSASFEELRSINEDVFGWLTIYGTNIDYPLLQGKDNEEYLSKEADGSASMSGSLFLDYRNDPSFTDFNSIVHGHYMQYGMLFGDIGNFKKKTYFNSHLYGNIYYEGEDHGVELFAYLKVNAYDTTYYTPGITEAESQELLLEKLEKDATHYRDVGVSIQDKLLFCSTCTSDLSDERQMLVGRITEDVFADPFEEETEDKTLIDNAKIILGVTPWWMYVLSLILLLICIRVLLKRRTREMQDEAYEEKK
jgi:sortase B